MNASLEGRKWNHLKGQYTLFLVRVAKNYLELLTIFYHVSNLVAKIETLLLEGPFDAICSATVIYHTMNKNNLSPYEYVRGIVERAVRSSLTKIEDSERKLKVLEILPEMESGYKSVVGLNTIKALNMKKDSTPDNTREEIERNIDLLKEKLNHPMMEDDVSLYDALKKKFNNIIISQLTWRDPEASMVLSDNSEIISTLKRRQKRVFMEPCEKMKCDLPVSVVAKCNSFVENFNKPVISRMTGNILHDKSWKENEFDLIKVAEHILVVLGEIWSNPAFATSTSLNEQSEGTYVTDVIVPLLRASLVNLPNGFICLSTAERQSLASKARRNQGVIEERMGKKPDVMGLIKQNDKIFELIYTESSRIICSETKKEEDDVKLWRETLDGASFISALCRPAGNQFGVVGIQVAGTTIYLNVLVKDLAGIPRYFHLDHAEIPLSPHQSRLKSLIRLLLTLRNVMIVNKSLLMQALEQATSYPPRNVNQSPTVSTPPYNK